ncbi:MAG: OmpH family outer membrane protein [Candidatus Omnitrophica bacterium]|nr:OmpH family outer membrane protein [Candidatus Omnitrophota bacterium]MBU0896017.1 OmpH family outer membrane protein [Candidatus Omnitrophota bacterium]MBU1811316.1 OmpH family outer membrane protein [Candidatus Omnitrophota bacterium]
MKRLLVVLLSLGLIGSFSFTAKSAEIKIGYVNIFEIFNEYGKTKEYDEMLEKKKQEEEKKLDTKKKEIEKMQGKLSLLKDKEQDKEQEKIIQAKEEYLELKRQVFTDLKEERDKKMEEIFGDINKVIKDYAEKNKFDLIINENGLLYGSKTMDVTSQILELVNKEKKK